MRSAYNTRCQCGCIEGMAIEGQRACVVIVPPEHLGVFAGSRNARRVRVVQSLLLSTGVLAGCDVRAARAGTEDEAALAHSRDYLEVLRTGEGALGREEAGLVDDCTWWPGVWQLALWPVGGVAVAVAELRRGRRIVCWMEGGRHHAKADAASGFCYCMLSFSQGT